jgi:hypothetical protein
MDFSSNTYLLDSSILQAQAQQYLTNPSPELVHHAAMLLSQVDQTEMCEFFHSTLAFDFCKGTAGA